MKETSLFEKYKEELTNDTHLDDFTLKERQLLLPTIKHKWVSRLIQQKIEKDDLQEAKQRVINKVKEKISNESVVTLSDKTIYLQAVQHDLVKKVEKKIQECDQIILYLEKTEKILSQMSFDIKNIIDIRKLELT